jgi:hypothetical protein
MFKKLPGVSVTLLSKKIALNTPQGQGVLHVCDNHYNINNLFSSQPTHTLFWFSGSKINSHVSKNFNIVQNSRCTHTGARTFHRLWNLDKLLWFFYKFKYFGKGLKIKKSTKDSLVIFNLGASHPSKLYFNTNNLSILRTKKNTYTVISLNKNNILTYYDFYKIRPYNLYTRRGLRLSRQPFCKRFGKVSQVAAKKR